MPKVDFVNNANDLDAATLAEYGLFSRTVGRMTGMTPARAQYRIWKSGESRARKAWREGSSETFKAVMAVVHKDVQSEVRQKIAKLERSRQKKVRARKGTIIQAE